MRRELKPLAEVVEESRVREVVGVPARGGHILRRLGFAATVARLKPVACANRV